MGRHRSLPLPIALLASGLTAVAAPSGWSPAAQEETAQEESAQEESGQEETGIELPAQLDEAQQEMLELFGRVERRLRAIDVLLGDAGAGRPGRLGLAEEAGIGELLDRSRDAGRQAIDDIDRILELARQMGQQQPSGSGGGQQEQQQQPDGSQSPLDRGPQSTERESTPEQPGPGPGEEPRQPEPNGQQDQPQDGPREGEDPVRENEPGADPPAGEVGGATRPPHASDRWGDLPVHVRDIFRTEGDRELPAEYRDWIDAYYRRLASRAGGR